MAISAGQRFGRLVVLGQVEAGKHPRWACKCDCGRSRAVFGQSLADGRTRSCGCLRRELTAARSVKHGLSGSSTYQSWGHMIQRCTNKSSRDYADYGGRGVTVCRRWLDFSNFLADMGEKPRGLSIDRIDNAKGYSKANCRWATPRQQAQNKRTNHMVSFMGETLPLAEWARLMNIPATTLRQRLGAYGWPIDAALLTPVRE